MLNNSGPRAKRSKLERDINIEIICQILMLLIMCSIGAIFNGFWINDRINRNIVYFPLTNSSVNPAWEAFLRFWTFIIIFQVIVPISLYITIEVVKTIQTFFMNWDLDMYHYPTDKPFECRALNINEDLGQIGHVFSDKTGTLTENEMIFRCCTISGTNYSHGLQSNSTSYY
jgi:magnesium-transporting ATPase (P-type)